MATASPQAPPALARELAGCEWIDLSVLVSESLPTWPLHMPFQRSLWNWYEPPTRPGVEWRSETPYHTAWWTIDEHTGTHFDAPTHFVPPSGSRLPDASPAGDVTGDQVDLAKLRGPACVVDVRDLVERAEPGVSPVIERDAVERFERGHRKLAPGDVVLFWSGWDERYRPGRAGDRYARDVVDRRIAGWPSPSPELIVALHERGIQTLGTDGCSIGSSEDGRPGHVAGLSRQMAYVESLTNLGRLPAVGAYFVFMPVKVAGSSGGPGRAVALVPPGGGSR
jgi:kynurenine formamidase